MRRSWPEVLEKIKDIRRVTWTLVSVNSTVLDYDGRRVLLGLSSEGLAQTFSQGVHAEVVRQGLVEAIGLDTRVEGTVAGGPSGRGGAGGAPGGPGPRPGGSARPGADASGTGARGGGPSPAEQLGVTPGVAPVDRAGTAPPAQEWSEAAREAPPAWATQPAGTAPAGAPSPPVSAAPAAAATAEAAPSRAEVPGGDVPREDDEDLESSGAVGPGVIESILGGTVIAVDDDPTH